MLLILLICLSDLIGARISDVAAQCFQAMERLAQERSMEFVSLPLAQKDLLWEEAKDAEPHGAPLSSFADASRSVRFNDA